MYLFLKVLFRIATLYEKRTFNQRYLLKMLIAHLINCSMANYSLILAPYTNFAVALFKNYPLQQCL